MVLLLVACAAPPRYAGCEVETRSFEADGTLEAEESETFDDAGHRIASSYRDGFVTESTTTTWDGDCPVVETATHEEDGETEAETTETTCDEHGHALEVTSTSTFDDRSPIVGYTAYTLEHDDQGRVTSSTTSGDSSDPIDETFTWGACDLPVEETWESDGYRAIRTRECDADGRTTEKRTESWNRYGTAQDTVVAKWTYDTLGRTATQSVGAGSEDPLLATYTWEQDDDPVAVYVRFTRAGEGAGWKEHAWRCE